MILTADGRISRYFYGVEYPGRDMRDAHAHLNVSQHDFDVVALEIAATLSFLGAPEKEHKEFMDLIESYRSMVVTPSA